MYFLFVDGFCDLITAEGLHESKGYIEKEM